MDIFQNSQVQYSQGVLEHSYGAIGHDLCTFSPLRISVLAMAPMELGNPLVLSLLRPRAGRGTSRGDIEPLVLILLHRNFRAPSPMQHVLSLLSLLP